MQLKTNSRGGYRKGSGRKKTLDKPEQKGVIPKKVKGVIKGHKIWRQIQVDIETFSLLDKIKKSRKSKNWSGFLSSLLD